MTTFHPVPAYPFATIPSPRCSRPASPAPPFLATGSREATPRTSTSLEPREHALPAAAHFRLADLAPELQLQIFGHVADLPPRDLATAVRVSTDWNAALTPHLYRALTVSRANRQSLLSGLGLDYLSASEIESRADEADYSSERGSLLAERKITCLSNTRHLTIADAPGALAVTEAIFAHANLFKGVDTLSLAAPVFRHLVNSGLAAFGRPRSGSAFVGETLVAHLRPKIVHVNYPTPRAGASLFDPVLLSRVMSVLLIEWKPESVVYHGVTSDFPPVLGKHTQIHCGPCSARSDHDQHLWDDGDDSGAGDESPPTACAAHGALIRMHLRRTFGSHARDELLEAIAEGADPTDDDDLDPDDVPDVHDAVVEYYNVPCISGAEGGKETFLDQTFTICSAEVDVAEHVTFYP